MGVRWKLDGGLRCMSGEQMANKWTVANWVDHRVWIITRRSAEGKLPAEAQRDVDVGR